VAELLVTGATGCIGRALIFAAARGAWSVRGLARSERPSWWPHEAKYIRADVLDDEVVARWADGCSAVVHLAAPAHAEALSLDPQVLIRSTVVGAANAARAARENGAAFVLVSTIAVYGSPPPPRCDEETPSRPQTPYGEAKVAAEERAFVEHRSPAVLRCAVVYGLGDRGNVARLIRAVDRGRGVIIGRGQNRKSLLFADNLADRILHGIAQGINGVWCVADSPAITQYALTNEVAIVLAKRRPPSVPLWSAKAGARVLDLVGRAAGSRGPRWRQLVQTLTSTAEVDGSALDDRLRYQQRYTMREGLERTAAWLRQGEA
jgi:nucleoside-diphosphate-sugar epimerase